MTNSEIGPIGARRFPKREGPGTEIVAGLGGVETTELSDAMRQVNSVDGRIRPLYSPMPRFAGSAVTVVVPTGSQEARRAAMAVVGPGEVLVIAAGGARVYAVLGGRLAAIVHRQGAAGVLIDGCVRDAEEIEALGLPVLCRGRSVAAAPKTGPGEVNVPVACGGAVVNPGDVVVGDSDGAVVIPREAATEVLAAVRDARSHA